MVVSLLVYTLKVNLIGVHTEGEFAGQVMKAQPISDPQLKKLRKFNKID